MKKIFTSVLLFLACFSAKAQTSNSDIFDFDTADTFYYYDWDNIRFAELTNNRLIIDTVNYKRNQWQIGKPQKHIFDSAYTLPNAIVTDTSFPCIPNDTSVFILKLPYTVAPYGLPLDHISFAYRLNIDSGDIALAEASIDSGLTWTNILADTNRSWQINAGDTPNLSVSTISWDSVLIYTHLPLFLLNDTVYLRFTFITGNDTIARDGWMIDHILASHYTEEVVKIENNNIFQLYPNPATKEVKLKLTNPLNTDCTMAVIDALGRQIFHDKLSKGSTEYTLQVNDWPQGMYFIELDDRNNNRMIRKLIVE